MRVVWALTLVLVIAGLYFLLFHMDPFPLNHEAVFFADFREMHVVHDVIGAVLIGLAGVIGWRARRARRTQTAM
jgi:hypothetical protein